MKLRNKKTGEVIEGKILNTSKYETLAELNEEWEDYEEPKKYWYISDGGEVYGFSEYFVGSQIEDDHREIHNLFETKEEAEKAVEKLKAWKRLKDKGFRFDGWEENHHNLGIIEFSFSNVEKSVYDFEKDLDLLFGGEE